jgi:putative acetyltransferase
VVHIRAERRDDAEAVLAVHEAAFGRPNEAELVAALRESAEPCLSLVAQLEGRLVGHVFFSPVSIEGAGSGAPACCGLAPVGVLPAQQRLGVGSALIRTGLRACGGLGWQAVFLVGDPRYYSRFGFAPAAPRGFHYRDQAYDAALQLLELRTDALSGLRGWVRFAEAFERTGTA